MSKKLKCFWDICFVVSVFLLVYLGLVSGFYSSFRFLSSLVAVCYIGVWIAYIFYNAKYHHKKRIYLIMIWLILSIVLMGLYSFAPQLADQVNYNYFGLIFSIVSIVPFVGIVIPIGTHPHYLFIASIYFLMLLMSIYLVVSRKHKAVL